MRVLLVVLLAAVALASGAATGASVGAAAAASASAAAGAGASATSTTSAGAAAAAAAAAAAGATAGASARARAAAMDFSDLNSLYPGANAANEPHEAAGMKRTIAGIDVSVFEEINKRAVDRALRLVDFDPDSIARISLLQTGDGVDLSPHDVHEASLRSITDALRGGRRPRAVFSLGDEDSAAVRRDIHVTAFIEEAMELNKQADDRFYPTFTELKELLDAEDVKPADAAAASAHANAVRGAPKTHTPPAPGAGAAAAARHAQQQKQAKTSAKSNGTPAAAPPKPSAPAPAPPSASFLEHSARVSVQAEARARAHAQARSGFGAAAAAGAGAGANAGAGAGARAHNKPSPSAKEAAGPNPLSNTANPPENPEEGGYQAPHAPPSFHEWLQGGATATGQTAENLGVDYKPDPRRHPPPPPVPNPPPPPPPSSFTAFSPLASFR